MKFQKINRHSDIDVLIIFEKLADKDKRKTAVDIRVALADLPIAKDIIVTTPEELEPHRPRIESVLHYAQQEEKYVMQTAEKALAMRVEKGVIRDGCVL